MRGPTYIPDWHKTHAGPAADNRTQRQKLGLAESLWLGMVGVIGVMSQTQITMAADNFVWEDLPRNTALVMTINTSASAWTELEHFRTAQLLDETLGITPNPGGLPYLPYDINFQTHIQPWVGSQTVVALLPAMIAGAASSITDHSVMLAPIQDQEAFNRYLQLLLDQQSAPPTTETFRQTEILFWPQDVETSPEAPSWEDDQGTAKTWGLAHSLEVPLPVTAPKALPQGGEAFDIDIPLPLPQPVATGLAIAVLPDTLVAAETPEAIKTFLRFRRSGQGQLTDNPYFQRTLAHPQQPKALVTIYGNALELLNFEPPGLLFPPVGLPGSGEFSPPSVEMLQALNFGGTLEALLDLL